MAGDQANTEMGKAHCGKLCRAGRRIAVCLLALLVAGFVVVQLTAGPFLEKKLESGLSARLGVPVTVGKVRVNLARGEVTLRKLSIANPAGFKGADAFTARKVSVNVSLVSLATPRIVVERVEISEPRLSAHFNAEGLSNWKQLREGKPTAPDGEEKPKQTEPREPEQQRGTEKSLFIRELVVEDAEAEFRSDHRKEKYAGDASLRVKNIVVRDVLISEVSGATRNRAQLRIERFEFLGPEGYPERLVASADRIECAFDAPRIARGEYMIDRLELVRPCVVSAYGEDGRTSRQRALRIVKLAIAGKEEDESGEEDSEGAGTEPGGPKEGAGTGPGGPGEAAPAPEGKEEQEGSSDFLFGTVVIEQGSWRAASW
ncbi:hypothetical protein HZA57_09470, partial [Candidatus Poribacteria bacterium]|nr:hypothetical protein [Candidatus Poribacteria bacterium]